MTLAEGERDLSGCPSMLEMSEPLAVKSFSKAKRMLLFTINLKSCIRSLISGGGGEVSSQERLRQIEGTNYRMTQRHFESSSTINLRTLGAKLVRKQPLNRSLVLRHATAGCDHVK